MGTTEIIYCIVGNPARNLTTGQLMPDFTVSHAEADDTTMFTIFHHLRSEGYTEPVTIDTEDTDN